MKWCLDTSALIEPWVRRYPPDVFPSVWDAVEGLIVRGQLCAPSDVKLEIERQSDGLCAWAQRQNGLFFDPTRSALEHLKRIVNDHPKFMKIDSLKSGADPMVVAFAVDLGVPVVTYEDRAKKDAAPKMPNVCDALGVKCVTLVDVLRSAGVRL